MFQVILTSLMMLLHLAAQVGQDAKVVCGLDVSPLIPPGVAIVETYLPPYIGAAYDARLRVILINQDVCLTERPATIISFVMHERTHALDPVKTSTEDCYQKEIAAYLVQVKTWRDLGPTLPRETPTERFLSDLADGSRDIEGWVRQAYQEQCK